MHHLLKPTLIKPQPINHIIEDPHILGPKIQINQLGQSLQLTVQHLLKLINTHQILHRRPIILFSFRMIECPLEGIILMS